MRELSEKDLLLIELGIYIGMRNERAIRDLLPHLNKVNISKEQFAEVAFTLVLSRGIPSWLIAYPFINKIEIVEEVNLKQPMFIEGKAYYLEESATPNVYADWVTVGYEVYAEAIEQYGQLRQEILRTRYVERVIKECMLYALNRIDNFVAGEQLHYANILKLSDKSLDLDSLDRLVNRIKNGSD